MLLKKLSNVSVLSRDQLIRIQSGNAPDCEPGNQLEDGTCREMTAIGDSGYNEDNDSFDNCHVG